MPTGKPTYQRWLLSGSTNGLPINIIGTTSASPTLLHTAHATDYDEVWLFAANYSSVDAFINLMLGGSSAHQILEVPIPAKRGLIPILSGQGTFTGGSVISAYTPSSGNIISITGYVNRIVYI